MKLRLIAMGKTSESYLKEGIAFYQTRLKHYSKFELIELDDIKTSRKISMNEFRKLESEKILAAVQSDQMISLDETGRKFTSFEFARFLNARMVQSVPGMDFIVGGAFGLDPAIREQSAELISLSDMTFSHQMVRLFFVEQLYRAMTIIKGEKYHHS